MEKARTPKEYRELQSKILKLQENVVQEEVRDKTFVEDKLRAFIKNASPKDKSEFALWISGVKSRKPLLVKELEYLNKVNFDFLKNIVTDTTSERYENGRNEF